MRSISVSAIRYISLLVSKFRKRSFRYCRIKFALIYKIANSGRYWASIICGKTIIVIRCWRIVRRCNYVVRTLNCMRRWRRCFIIRLVSI